MLRMMVSRREEDDDADVEEEDDNVEEEDRSQDREAHFVRACAVEMQINMSQDATFYRNSQEKCRGP